MFCGYNIYRELTFLVFLKIMVLAEKLTIIYFSKKHFYNICERQVSSTNNEKGLVGDIAGVLE